MLVDYGQRCVKIRLSVKVTDDKISRCHVAMAEFEFCCGRDVEA